MIRYCIRCNTEIERCNGFVLARDLVAFFEGETQSTNARELCGRCVLLAKPVAGEPPYIDAEEEPR